MLGLEGRTGEEWDRELARLVMGQGGSVNKHRSLLGKEEKWKEHNRQQ